MRSSFLLVLVLSLAAAARAEESRYVVTLAQTATMDAESLAATYGGKVLRVIDEVTIEVEVPSSRARLLSHDARVLGMRASNFRVATSGWTSAMSFAYDAAGNVRQIGSDTFAYDDVDRVVSATVSSGTETFTTETFTYDAYGNRTGCTNVTAGNSACQTVTIASGTNRISGMSYDAMGNLEQGGIYAYDSVGMLKRDTATGASREYLYTADDERLAVVVGGSNWTWTLRDLSGKVLREYTSTSSSGNHSNWTWTRDNVYRNGQMLSSLQPGGNGATVTWHYHLDHLGTPRVLSSTTGTILAVHDYGAFGTEISGNAAEAPLSRMKYTGHERDTFNNPSNPLDYMHARYYSANWGRFLSVDPTWSSADLGRPQSWNRYAYVMNNPINRTDPDGRSWMIFNRKNEEISLYDKDGKALGTWKASNHPQKNPASAAPLATGRYSFLDTKTPHTHGSASSPATVRDANGNPVKGKDGKAVTLDLPDDSKGGKFGSYGIFRLTSITDDVPTPGKVHEGIGVHSGRDGMFDKAGRTGWEATTQGCIRTTDDAIKTMTDIAPSDPLDYVEVKP